MQSVAPHAAGPLWLQTRGAKYTIGSIHVYVYLAANAKKKTTIACLLVQRGHCWNTHSILVWTSQKEASREGVKTFVFGLYVVGHRINSAANREVRFTVLDCCLSLTAAMLIVFPFYM